MGKKKLRETEVIDLSAYKIPDGAEATAPSHAMDELPAGTMLLQGQFRITGYLNSGGFGITYRARDSLGRPVVIKECFPSGVCRRDGTRVVALSVNFAEALAETIDQFVKEAHSLAAIRHENVVHVHQVFEENSTAYMAIDFVDGPDLLDIIEARPINLTPDDIIRITTKALFAIKFVHDNGMLHRDISPDNILIDEAGEPILIDFGAARRSVNKTVRVMSQMKFVKDGYSPQEFYIKGSEQGPWSDLYSFAATLYHLISGEAPPDGQKRLSALAQKKPDPYVPLEGRIDGYPPEFLRAIDVGLKTIPEDRVQSADAWLTRIGVNPSGDGDTPAPAPEPIATTAFRKITSRLPSEIGTVIATEMRDTRSPLVLGAASVAILLGVGAVGYMTLSPAQENARAFATAAPQLGAPDPAGFALGADLSTTPEASVTAPTTAVLLPPLDLDAFGTPNLSTRTDAAWVEARSMDQILAAHHNRRPLPDPADLVSNVPPTIILPTTASTDFAFTAGETPRAFDAPAAFTGVERMAVLVAQPPLSEPAAVVVDTTPPPAPILTGPVDPVQITAAHWDVEMPFEARLEQVRNARTAVIETVTPDANLSIAGAWIAEGATIYAFNGETLLPDTPISVHLLNALTIDPDGYTRATVRYRGADNGQIDRGLLAVRAVREIMHADGTAFEARVAVDDPIWITRVTSTPEATESPLRTGDVLLGETVTGIAVDAPESLQQIYEALVAADAKTASFEIRRDGDTRVVEVPLARLPADGASRP